MAWTDDVEPYIPPKQEGESEYFGGPYDGARAILADGVLTVRPDGYYKAQVVGEKRLLVWHQKPVISF